MALNSMVGVFSSKTPNPAKVTTSSFFIIGIAHNKLGFIATYGASRRTVRLISDLKATLKEAQGKIGQGIRDGARNFNTVFGIFAAIFGGCIWHHYGGTATSCPVNL